VVEPRDGRNSIGWVGFFPPDGRRYHYWDHLGEAMAVRQLLGHPDLPTFVGDIDKAPYRPET
jgi:hypothetical protein